MSGNMPIGEFIGEPFDANTTIGPLSFCFYLAALGTLLGRSWQVFTTPNVLGPIQSTHQWWYLTGIFLSILVVLWLFLKRIIAVRMITWLFAVSITGALLIIPIISVLNKPLHAYSVGKFAAQFLTPVLVFMIAMSYSRLAVLRV